MKKSSSVCLLTMVVKRFLLEISFHKRVDSMLCCAHHAVISSRRFCDGNL